MNMKDKIWRWRLVPASLIAGVLAIAIAVGWGIRVYAQETLASVGAATAAGAGLGAAAGLRTPSQYAAPATGAAAGRGMEGGDASANPGAPGAAGAAATGADGTQVSVRVTTQPLRWGPDSGDEMVRQLTAANRYPARDRVRRSPRAAAAYSRRLARMTPRQRTRMVLAKYQKPPVGYLSWYLPQDRYKVTSKVWQFVTTPNDRFYYHPWAPAMKLRNPSRVIGFHTWQDAMIAGYRPDPLTRPEPAGRLTQIARYTHGPNLSTYFEYVYAGQITPSNFESHFKYIQYVANELGRHSHTRNLVGSTVEQVLGALVGQGDYPRFVGGTPAPVSADEIKSGAMAGSLPPPNLQPGGTDKREEDFNKFGNRAGSLANTPGNR
jgi:hypothetical protein